MALTPPPPPPLPRQASPLLCPGLSLKSCLLGRGSLKGAEVGQPPTNQARTIRGEEDGGGGKKREREEVAGWRRKEMEWVDSAILLSLLFSGPLLQSTFGSRNAFVFPFFCTFSLKKALRARLFCKLHSANIHHYFHTYLCLKRKLRCSQFFNGLIVSTTYTIAFV